MAIFPDRQTSQPVQLPSDAVSAQIEVTSQTTVVGLFDSDEGASAALASIWPQATRLKALAMAVGDASDEQRAALAGIRGAIVSKVGEAYAGIARLVDGLDVAAGIWHAGEAGIVHPALAGNLGANRVYAPVFVPNSNGGQITSD